MVWLGCQGLVLCLTSAGPERTLATGNPYLGIHETGSCASRLLDNLVETGQRSGSITAWPPFSRAGLRAGEARFNGF